MIAKFFEIYNWRFWWFIFITFMPCWAGIIGCSYLMIKEKIEEIRNDR